MPTNKNPMLHVRLVYGPNEQSARAALGTTFHDMPDDLRDRVMQDGFITTVCHVGVAMAKLRRSWDVLREGRDPLDLQFVINCTFTGDNVPEQMVFIGTQEDAERNDAHDRMDKALDKLREALGDDAKVIELNRGTGIDSLIEALFGSDGPRKPRRARSDA